MGLFDLFKKKEKNIVSPKDKTQISPEEKKYYQPDSYYTDVSHEGTIFEKKVITFEERKKTAIPSKRGLYPAEILLLEYCSYGTYPGPKNGYPGFWWFEYGIRDVGAILKSLEERGYIALTSAMDSVNSLTIPQLKELLAAKGQSVIGKKSDLVLRVTELATEEELLATGIQLKYAPTEIGQQELSENAYVPYMHKSPEKTIENSPFGHPFNVWSINKLLGEGDKSNWKDIVSKEENSIKVERNAKNEASMRYLEKNDPKLYNKFISKDQQLADIQEAKNQYAKNGDLNSYIVFWEGIWANGGLLFEGSVAHFTLVDLYIKANRYDDATAFLKKLMASKPNYKEKAESYLNKIDALKIKKNTKMK